MKEKGDENMKTLKQRVSYLKGLADGLNINSETREGRLLVEVIDVLRHMAEKIDELDEAYEELADYVESIDEDLEELEEELDTVCDCGHDHDEFEDLDEDEFVDVECPNCHEIVAFERDIIDDEDLIEVTCPNCDTVVFVNDQDVDWSEVEKAGQQARAEEEDI
ncbi:hypothetical protein SAMN02745885_02527 [Carboxydocella sporoproducens DSM 16521]|uniref:AraC family transcriptional regulator n=3 Tax=Clostridiales Family XVI. Incertae Sedis TaxID=543347 RepID=A0A1T4S998_9FIRM|nr:hypothetical protein CFE_0933 [Carboxydocella thermautotrophica]SKA24789.1 hypothetical protein SAMN02745885_02527 [Carboxydocella sporoproducens DSM 16521]